MGIETTVVAVAFAGYLAAAVLAVAALRRPAFRGERWSLGLIGGAAAALLAVLAGRLAETGVIPTLTRFEALACYVVAASLAFLILMAARPLRGLAAFLLPYLALVLAWGLPEVAARATPPPPLQNGWLRVHVFIAFASYACFSLASVMAAAYLVQDRNLKLKRFGAVWEQLPNLETLDRLMGLLVGFGFVLYTGSVLLGIVLAHQSGGGEEWLTDPKVGAAAVTWVLFAVLVHWRASETRHGKRMAVVTIAGMACMLFTFIGVHLFSHSIHGFVRILPGP